MLARGSIWAGFGTLLMCLGLVASYARANETVTVSPPVVQDSVVHSGPTHTVNGHWYRGTHKGKHGWWWIVGEDWFYAKRPNRLSPERYVPPGEAPGWWYMCPDNATYYPFATKCLSRWVRVQPR